MTNAAIAIRMGQPIARAIRNSLPVWRNYPGNMAGGGS
jgi:hypothetical protein